MKYAAGRKLCSNYERSVSLSFDPVDSAIRIRTVAIPTIFSPFLQHFREIVPFIERTERTGSAFGIQEAACSEEKAGRDWTWAEGATPPFDPSLRQD